MSTTELAGHSEGRGSRSADGLEVERVRAALGGFPGMLAALAELTLWLDLVLDVGHPSVPRK